MADVSIRPKPNGPYLVEGPVDIYDTAGNKIATDDRPKIALCRCGASSNKPFCDGTHSKIGFQAAETINPESAEPADAAQIPLRGTSDRAVRRSYVALAGGANLCRTTSQSNAARDDL